MGQKNKTELRKHFYRASATNFMKVPGNPLVYWLSSIAIKSFESCKSLGKLADIKQGMSTTDSDRFVRNWSEINFNNIGFNFSSAIEGNNKNKYWFPFNRGGKYRKWYGNLEQIVRYEDNGNILLDIVREKYPRISDPEFVIKNRKRYFIESVTYSAISSTNFGVRLMPKGFIFSIAGPVIQSEKLENELILALLLSPVTKLIVSALSPTLNFQAVDLEKIPIDTLFINDSNEKQKIKKISKSLINTSKSDWDSYEESWDFKSPPIISNDNTETQNLLFTIYKKIYDKWQNTVLETQHLEEENNRIFIDAYGLQDELTPEVPLKEITLTCNPHYRYGGDLTEQEREDRLQSDTIAELLSYAIGCMMGRYSLDREGLVYAHAGNQGFADLVAEGAYKTFAADDDGILPLTEQEWFSDDVTNRISEFVRTVWGEQHLEENLQFIADSLCLYALKAKKGERALDTIRRYLSNQFYKDHLKTYKRRPIYWLFSSGKHKAFECLVYLHRYHEGTLARMRAEYVIPLSSRINARINRLSEEADAADSTAERNQINRELKTLHNQQAELATFDEQLRHHADMRIPLDLDDGVKENYGKFGNLLDSVKAVTGQAAE